ncbi:pyrimidine 5'-nucleotidase [Crenobacter cavernae]|uniref:Pyrimidine 5'-nucleotidase n=1 Tax=Crenobacter cavernae TaxID=2290923 RepID=A0ABY0FEQ5_9NEIS|nr:pyrimidine 5'-nucleotidase [Crenobacter cavernae]RXZ43089.1 pyrimidine 5'-nucleotidase [Crenobacter cavernae]
MALTWIFDLDNTLHDASHGIFPHINRAMTDYMMRHLDLSLADAEALRQRYWMQYGATLKGLIQHHGIDAHHFLTTTHPLDELAQWLCWEAGLAEALRRLPGRKVVLSNGPTHYVEGVVERMGVERHFFDCYGVERLAFRPKPHKAAFRAVLAEHRLDPARCVMVEDSLENLKSAKALGMRTVWVSREARRPAYVDRRIVRIAELLRF